MNARVKNPFLISGYVSPDYFCDREAEKKKILGNIENGKNVVLVSPRRMGKTGLIYHCYHSRQVQKEYHTFFIDIYPTGTLKEFVYFLGKAIFEKLKGNGQKFFDKFFGVITSLRPAFKLDPIHGGPVFDIGIGEITEPEVSMQQIFEYLEKAGKPCIVAIDEFQQIAHYPEKNVEALLRTYIQQCRNANFIFAGSEQHMMQDIFLTASRPFYQSVAFLELGPVPPEKYNAFAIRHFTQAGKDLPVKLVRGIYKAFEGHTWYIQYVLNTIYAYTASGDQVTEEGARLCVEESVYTFENVFKRMMAELSERQKELLIAIAKEDQAIEITSTRFIRKHGLTSPSSVQSAARYLLSKDMINRSERTYRINDRFLRIWIANEYGLGYNYPFD